ncbi:Rid family detoxifying hydrolase [Kineobactrum salinum]|uniref:RidA family protein n=1 Tax=Kineobactrum salinum TaxID=2708301 RepID=A0A6C0TZ20_9GAMM|nr:Rid family detoxifying hydrolase [Kineobactrum salinum]QIB64619.1 RidA family protein [Kineobactrum salinum]
MLANLKTLTAGLVLVLTASLLSAAEVEYLNDGAVLSRDVPFSAVVRVDDTYYLSGQLGVKPGTLELVPGGIRAEARQTMENIAAVLAANGLSMDDVVKCTVMLADMSEWATFNEVYRSFFSKHFPARSAFGTAGLGLGARTEVECMAVASDGR